MFMMTFYFSRVTDLTYAKSAPEIHYVQSAPFFDIFRDQLRNIVKFLYD